MTMHTPTGAAAERRGDVPPGVAGDGSGLLQPQPHHRRMDGEGLLHGALLHQPRPIPQRADDVGRGQRQRRGARHAVRLLRYGSYRAGLFSWSRRIADAGVQKVCPIDYNTKTNVIPPLHSTPPTHLCQGGRCWRRRRGWVGASWPCFPPDSRTGLLL